MCLFHFVIKIEKAGGGVWSENVWRSRHPFPVAAIKLRSQTLTEEIQPPLTPWPKAPYCGLWWRRVESIWSRNRSRNGSCCTERGSSQPGMGQDYKPPNLPMLCTFSSKVITTPKTTTGDQVFKHLGHGQHFIFSSQWEIQTTLARAA